MILKTAIAFSMTFQFSLDMEGCEVQKILSGQNADTANPVYLPSFVRGLQKLCSGLSCRFINMHHEHYSSTINVVFGGRSWANLSWITANCTFQLAFGKKKERKKNGGGGRKKLHDEITSGQSGIWLKERCPRLFV